MILDDTCEILDLLYKHGWDERNGGNLSLLLTKEEAKTITKNTNPLRSFHVDFDISFLNGFDIIVTGTGKYFKNCLKDPEDNLGLLMVQDSHTLGLIWGFSKGGAPTSELPTHLKSHMQRLKADKNHRVVIHCHPTNLIAMSHIHELDSASFTRDLWRMQTESIVVFPEGVYPLPWMLCGGNDIGDATADKMRDYRVVIWASHGIFATGTNLDETFGLIETIEKAAEIYMKIFDKKIYQSITNEELIELSKAFHVKYKKGIID